MPKPPPTKWHNGGPKVTKSQGHGASQSISGDLGNVRQHTQEGEESVQLEGRHNKVERESCTAWISEYTTITITVISGFFNQLGKCIYHVNKTGPPRVVQGGLVGEWITLLTMVVICETLNQLNRSQNIRQKIKDKKIIGKKEQTAPQCLSCHLHGLEKKNQFRHWIFGHSKRPSTYLARSRLSSFASYALSALSFGGEETKWVRLRLGNLNGSQVWAKSEWVCEYTMATHWGL